MSELRNMTALIHDFPTISFDYSLAKTLNNKDLLFKALAFGMIKTIYLFNIDRFKFQS